MHLGRESVGNEQNEDSVIGMSCRAYRAFYAMHRHWCVFFFFSLPFSICYTELIYRIHSLILFHLFYLNLNLRSRWCLSLLSPPPALIVYS